MGRHKIEKLAHLSGRVASKVVGALERRGYDIRGRMSAPISSIPRRAPPRSCPSPPFLTGRWKATGPISGWKVRATGRIVSVEVIVAVAFNSDGRREVLGIAIGASEAETFWTGRRDPARAER